jgi:hypothetical protein
MFHHVSQIRLPQQQHGASQMLPVLRGALREALGTEQAAEASDLTGDLPRTPVVRSVMGISAT